MRALCYRAVGERGNDRLVEAHHQFWPSEKAMAEGSPQLILERGEPVEKPPTLIMQGTADDNLIPDMAADFAAAYTKAGGSISFHRFEGQPHAFIARDPAALDALRVLGLIVGFHPPSRALGAWLKLIPVISIVYSSFPRKRESRAASAQEAAPGPPLSRG